MSLTWIAAGFVVLAIAVLFFPDYVIRVFIHKRFAPPVPMPKGAVVLESPNFMRFMGWFGKIGGAKRPRAVTLGMTIVVPRYTITGVPEPSSDLGVQQINEFVLIKLLTHERAHVQQCIRYGRTYFVRYVFGFLRHGYSKHPFEIEAEAEEHAVHGVVHNS